MRLKIGVGMLSFAVVVLVGQTALGIEEEAAQPPIGQVREVASGGIRVDVAEPDFLGITAVDDRGDFMVLDFVPNEGSETWAPLLPGGTEAESFGADLHTWLMPWGMIDDPQNRPRLRPLDSSIAEVPHDDVSVFVVNEDLVLVALLNQGQVVGIYYGVNTAAELGGTAPGPTPRQIVCNILYDTCLSRKDTYWVFACAAWLYFCAGTA